MDGTTVTTEQAMDESSVSGVSSPNEAISDLPRGSDAVINQKKLYGNGYTLSGLNQAYGGSSGWGMNMARLNKNGKVVSNWISNAPYVPTNIIPVLLQYPKGFDLFDSAKDLKEALKNLVERQPKSISGLTNSLEIDVNETPFGSAGLNFQTVSKVTRDVGSVTMTFDEKVGLPVWNMLNFYTRMLLADPDTNTPMVTTMVPDFDENVWTPDYYTMSMLFIQPNQINTRADQAWLVVNMFPLSDGGAPEGERNPTDGKDIKEVEIEFAGMPIVNESTRRLGDNVLRHLRGAMTDPNNVILPVGYNGGGADGVGEYDYLKAIDTSYLDSDNKVVAGNQSTPPV
jgi:hypothetical protein